MNNHEAIDVLLELNRTAKNQPDYVYEALYLATKALEKIDLIYFNVHALNTLCNEPKKGKWIETEHLNLRQCSNCKAQWGIYSIEDFDFCPSCGADMREAGNDM